MMKSNLIPNLDKNFDSCTTCMLTKITRQHFKSIKRSSRVLDLIYWDVCDLHGWPTIGGKKYLVTFIDDCTWFCYVYLLNSKDEILDKFKMFKTQVELNMNLSLNALEVTGEKSSIIRVILNPLVLGIK